MKIKIHAILLIGFILLACSSAEASKPTLPKAEFLPTPTIKVWQSEGKKFTFVDVREASEYAAGHLDGAINVSYLEIEKTITEKKFDHQQPYVFYCTYSSWRAPYAANVMQDLGYTNSYVLEGGISGWNAGGQVIYSDTGTEAKIIPYPEAMAKVLHHPKDAAHPERIYLTRQELSAYNGQDGRPAYVAVNGQIYDLTQSRLWRGGIHDPGHGKIMAGQDLTEMLKESPHGDKHLKDFPIVGELVEDKIQN